MRFTAAKCGKRGLVQVDYARAPVRLGHSAFLTGRLTDENLDAAAEAMVDFRRRLDREGVDGHRAVATSAVREAENGGELVERARREASIEIELIDGREEARLVWVAVRDRLEVEGRWLLVDLGGGSMEVSTVRKDGLERSGSYPLGTVRLLERLEAEGGGGGAGAGDDGGVGGADGGGGRDGRAGDAVDEELAELESELAIPDPGAIRGMMATGGNIEALAGLAGAKPDRTGMSRVSLADLSRTMARVESLTYEQRMKKLDLRPDRADVIVPAGRLYRRVAELAGVDEVLVPNVSVSDGILLELA